MYIKEKLYLGGGYYDAFAVYVKQGGVWQMNYVCRDYLGSVTHITDAAGSLLAEYSYDAWGRLRNPVDQKVYAQDAEPELLLGRGYTGHEHLSFFGLINMNARLYDPILGLFLSPDPYVQLPDNTMNYNRYAYAMNNPLKYTDRSGEKWWHWLIGDVLTGGLLSGTAALTATATYATVFPMTNQGYELQKYISPVAFKVNVGFGSIQSGFGFDMSVGMMKGSGGVGRVHFGATYYASSYGEYSGWETRSGWEVEGLPLISYSSTTYKAGEFSQTTGMMSFGDPMTSISYENDYMFGLPGADNGDRWRSAAVGMNFGMLSVNLNMFTGDPGLDKEYRSLNTEGDPGSKYYTGGTSLDPKLRAGVFSIGIGPFRFGKNSEKIRHTFQNKFAHDTLMNGQNSPDGPFWHKVLDIPSSSYWGFGMGSGNSLW